jgi:hypothetical protein
MYPIAGRLITSIELSSLESIAAASQNILERGRCSCNAPESIPAGHKPEFDEAMKGLHVVQAVQEEPAMLQRSPESLNH